jgi:hypothetical protein
VYDQYRHTYENFQSKLPARLPYSFDQVLSKIPLGQQIAEAKRIHDLFTNHLDAQQQGGNLYRQLGDGTPETLTTNHPQESPWAQIRDNVIARATVIHGRAGDGSDGINRLEFRILGHSTQGKALKGGKVAFVPILIEGAISIFEILGEVLTTAETAGGAVSAGEGAAAATTIVADGAIAGTEVDVATVAGRAAQARRLTLKSSDILYGSGRALQALTVAPAIEKEKENEKCANVVRGGIATPRQIQDGVREHSGVPGLTGFSVQSAPGKTIEELASAGQFKNAQISVTTDCMLKRIGVLLVKSPGRSIYHNTAVTQVPLSNEQAAAIAAVFTTMPNPAQAK